MAYLHKREITQLIMGLSNTEETQMSGDQNDNDHRTSSSTLPSEVWCLFRVQGNSLVELSTRKTCNKATSVEEEYFWRIDEKDEDSEEEFYSTVEETDMEDCLSSADISICSYRSTATMEQGELAEQLALVQEMVQEMKMGFSTAMEELANIQFGDQTLQQQMVTDRAESQKQAKQMTETVQALRQEVESLAGQMKSVVDNQKKLEDKLDSVQQFNKEAFLEELQSLGVLTGEKQRDDSTAKDVNSVVQPYLASLPQQHKGIDDSDAQSVTALACKSLNLSQALHEKCLHLDMSPSSDDDDSVRHAQSAGLSMLMREPVSHLLDAKAHFSSKKVPPHEKFLEEVQREKFVQETVSAEKSYCSQLWNLIDTYVRPLQQGELMSSRDLNSIFPAYIPQLYEQHCILLRKMEERMLKWKYNGMIGDVLVKLTDAQEGEGLALYKDYISDFPTIINNINCWFSQSSRFREVMRSTSLASSSIVPLLLAPLQQIPTYSLLIKSLLKHTGMDHPDRYYLDTALARLKHFLGVMNSDLEHAMQFLNISKTPLTRSRDYGNSTRSRSSGSSCEANQASSARDSGIHSNGEDNLLRQPASPNTTRKYVLQVLRDRREREAAEHLQETRERPISVPPRSHGPSFGSHPDLSHSELSALSGTRDLPSYMPYQSGSKMYSSLTKIPTRDPPKSPEKPPRKIKIRRKTDVQKLPINSNYLRPLTPHLPFNSTPRSDITYNDSETRRPRSMERRPRSARPASSIDFTGSDIERREKMIEQLSLQSSDVPRSHGGDGRPRSDLHMSLQRLLAERERSDALENERYDREDHCFQPLDASSMRDSDHYRPEENEMYHHSNQNYLVHDSQEMHSSRNRYRNHPTDNLHQEEDYGIFGDDDDEETYPQEVHNTQPQRSIQEQISTSRAGHRRGSRRRHVLSQEQLAYTLAHSLKDSDLRQDGLEEEKPYTRQAERISNSVALTTSSSIESGPQDNLESTLSSTQEKHQSDDSSSIEFSNIAPKSIAHPSSENDRNRLIPNTVDKSKISENDTVSKLNTLERSQKYIQSGKTDEFQTQSQQENQNHQVHSETRENSAENHTSVSDLNKNNVKLRTLEKHDPVKRKSLPLVQHYRKDAVLSPISSVPSNVTSDEANNVSASRVKSSNMERTPKKLPTVHGRRSVPILDPSLKTTPAPVSPTSPTRLGAKDTKIPLYTPGRTKKDKAPPTPHSNTPLSKSSEDVSKMKRKTPFKQSLKNFFGRKRKKDKSEKYEVKEASSMDDLRGSDTDTDTPFTEIFHYEDDADFYLEGSDAPSSVV